MRRTVKGVGISGGTGAPEESKSHVFCSLQSSQLGANDSADGIRSPSDITKRLDRLIDEIRTTYHGSAIGKPTDDENAQTSDVLLVAHGHILRAFAMRWIGKGLTEGISLILEGVSPTFTGTVCAWLTSLAGGVGTLSYEHKNIEEPAIL